jgi:hypothetical protein
MVVSAKVAQKVFWLASMGPSPLQEMYNKNGFGFAIVEI